MKTDEGSGFTTAASSSTADFLDLRLLDVTDVLIMSGRSESELPR